MKMRIVRLGLMAGLLVCLLMASVAPAFSASPKVISVEFGGVSGAAVLDDGSLWTWGLINSDIFKPGFDPKVVTPVKVNLTGIRSVALGTDYALAVKDDGTVWGFGVARGGWNQGAGDNGTFQEPIQVKGLGGVIKVATLDDQCLALGDDGTLRAWGDNRFGRLGIGNTSVDTIVNMPVRVPMDDVKDIACTNTASYVLKNDGTLWAAGWGEDCGLLGTEPNTSSSTFIRLPIANVTSISCCYNDIIAVKGDGTAWVWGVNDHGQAGRITTNVFQRVPVKVEGVDNAVSASMANSYAIALDKDGNVFIWGAWTWGAQPMGPTGMTNPLGPDSPTPAIVKGVDHVKAAVAGLYNVFELKDDGTLWCLNWDASGVVTPTQVVFSQVDNKPGQASPAPVVAAPLPPVNQSNATVTEKWSVNGGTAMDYIAAGDNGTLYAFSNNSIYLYDSSGKLEWSLTMPAEYRVCNSWLRPTSVRPEMAIIQQVPPEPVYATADGYIYIYALPNADLPSPANGYTLDKNIGMDSLSWELFAISPGGKIAWHAPLKTDLTTFDDTTVKAAGDRVYVFHCYNETVFDRSGKMLFSIENVSDPAAVDERGYLYVTRSLSQYWPSVNQYDDNKYTDFRTPSGIVDAYYPNGTLCWQKDIGKAIQRQYLVDDIRSQYDSMPIYQDHTLYIAFDRGIMALGQDGNEKWTRAFDNGTYKLFDLMPVDSRGNLYVQRIQAIGFDTDSQLYVIGPDGRDLCPPRNYTKTYTICARSAARDGIIYDAELLNGGTKPLGDASFRALSTGVIRAYDLVNDSVLWQYAVPASDMHEATIDAGNIDALLYFARGDKPDFLDVDNKGIKEVTSDDEICVYPAGDMVYIGYSLTNYERPVVYGKSRCVYSSGIIALGADGVPVLVKPEGSRVSMLTANNSTVYFLSGNGNISSIAIAGIASGIAILALLAVFAKFFMAGTVARARSRLDKNQNRTGVLRYITANPGLTMRDISRGLGMNAGTVRYHLLILGLNHRIATFKDDNKFVRYFPNSNRYSKEEQLLVSMMRRDAIKRVIQILFMKPGLTNVEISSVTGLIDSGVSRYLKELCDKGIVSKSEVTSGRYAYSLTEEASKTVEKLYWVMNGEGRAQASGPGNAEA